MSKWKELLGEEVLTNVIRNGVNEEVIDFIKDFGEHLVKKEDNYETVSTSQVRKFFGEVKRQQMNGYNLSSFVLLKPQLAYAVGRVKKENEKKYKNYKMDDFYNVLSKAIDIVIEEEKNGNQKAFKNFIDIFESIVAYHKYAEMLKP